MIKRRQSLFKKRKPNKKIDYSNRKLENPFFRKKRRRKFKLPKISIGESGFKKKLIIALTILLASFVLWFFLFSSFFKITSISIRGLSRVSVEEVEDISWQQTQNRRFLLGSQKNIFLFSKNKYINNLKEKYTFENIEVEKKLPNELIIKIQEKSYAYIWIENDKYYYCDIDGYIIHEISPLDIKEKRYPLILNKGSSKADESKVNIDSKNIEYIINLFNEFAENNYELNIERFIVDDEKDTIQLDLESGPIVYFNTNEDAKKQISKLVILKNERLKDDFNTKNYIDLRYGERIYYR